MFLVSSVRISDKLAQVQSALARIDDGTYGICVECGSRINPARLELRPFAIRCIACQQVADGQPGRQNGARLPSAGHHETKAASKCYKEVTTESHVYATIRAPRRTE